MAKFDPALLPTAPDLALEQALWKAGFSRLCGLDEAGRGALAGPVAAAGVILSPNHHSGLPLTGVRDSKTLSPARREHLAAKIKETALAWGIGFATATEIDHWGILPATRLAMNRSLEALAPPPDYLLIDYILLPDLPIPQTALTKGDARSLSIAAASILAKVARDRLMRAMDDQFPGYGFARHKGYGTLEHRQRLASQGACPIHRLSFAPLRVAHSMPEPV